MNHTAIHESDLRAELHGDLIGPDDARYDNPDNLFRHNLNIAPGMKGRRSRVRAVGK